MAFDKLKNPELSSTRQTEPLKISKERLLWITKRARTLFLAYPSRDYDDPDGALSSYIEVLSGYSDPIVEHITDNKTGLQRRSTFPPRISELVTACDECASYLERKKRYENWGKNETPVIEPPRETRPTYEQLKEKYGDWTKTEEDNKPKWFDKPPVPMGEDMVETDAQGRRHIKVSAEFRRAMREQEELDAILFRGQIP